MNNLYNNQMLLAIECIIANALLTAFVFIGTKDDKTKLKGFYYYPKEIQERIRTIPEHIKHIPKESAQTINFVVSFAIFLVIFSVCNYINGTVSFINTFTNSVILGVVMNLYDLVILDIIWFPNSIRARVTGTEDMSKEYRNYKGHVKAFLRGIIMTFAGAFIVGIIFIILY